MSEDFYLNKTVDEDDPSLGLDDGITAPQMLQRMNTEESTLLNDSVSLLEDSPDGGTRIADGRMDQNSPMKGNEPGKSFTFDGVGMI